MSFRPALLALATAAASAACGSGPATPADPTPAPAPPTAGGNGAVPAPPHVVPPVGHLSEPHGPPYPIVLMHGMGGFDKLTGPVPLTYFNDVIADLAASGETDVYVTVAPPYDTSEDRAQAVLPQIQQILDDTGKDKVNLVGHSQGGMDARLVASPAGLAFGRRIASVTTVATPHQGSLVADAVLGTLQGVDPSAIDQVTTAALSLLEKTAYDVQNDPQLRAQLTELSHQYMTTVFNPKYVDDPDVAYSSYGGRTNLETGQTDCASAVYADDPSRVDVAQPEVQPLAQFLQGTTDVTNDGLVTVESARWGTFLQCVPADHLKEVGQIAQNGADPTSGFDHLAFFRQLVARIRAAGY
ncbi:MAG TPA: alpha/beta fold hydrolase [Polyangiaceae bacterium]